MKNVAASIPEDPYRQARVLAAEHVTSVSALVAKHLRTLADDDTRFTRLRELQR